MKRNTIMARKPLFMSLFVSAFLLVFLAVTPHARTLSERLMQVTDDLEMLTNLPPPPSAASLLQKMTYSSWNKFMSITEFRRPSPPSPPPPDSSDPPDQGPESSTSPCLGESLCSGYEKANYDSSLSSDEENYKVTSMVDYKNNKSSPPPPPSSSKPPVTVAKPSAPPPPLPGSSESPVQISYNDSSQIPTIASS